MDKVEPGKETIFKSEGSKIDLETKVWHFYYKMSASACQCQSIKELSTSIRENLMSKIDVLNNESPQNRTETRMIVQNRKILYEVDAFFTAGRSALDFMASILSRYIKGKDTDKFTGIEKILHDSSHPIAKLVVDNWVSWVKEFIDYRNYLVHRGVLPTPCVIQESTAGPQVSDPEVNKFINQIRGKYNRPIIFPLPEKPNPSIRITRYEVLGLDPPELPEGVIKESMTISTSPCKKSSGPKVGVSLGLSNSLRSIELSQHVSLGDESQEIKLIGYMLAPGYIEADSLCNHLYDKLVDLTIKIFGQLIESGFAHID